MLYRYTVRRLGDGRLKITRSSSKTPRNRVRGRSAKSIMANIRTCLEVRKRMVETVSRIRYSVTDSAATSFWHVVSCISRERYLDLPCLEIEVDCARAQSLLGLGEPDLVHLDWEGRNVVCFNASCEMNSEANWNFGQHVPTCAYMCLSVLDGDRLAERD